MVLLSVPPRITTPAEVPSASSKPVGVRVALSSTSPLMVEGVLVSTSPWSTLGSVEG
jgi:hypothetical protein